MFFLAFASSYKSLKTKFPDWVIDFTLSISLEDLLRIVYEKGEVPSFIRLKSDSLALQFLLGEAYPTKTNS